MAEREQGGSGVVSSSSWLLPESAAIRRQPRAPRLARPAAFHEAFEARALVYDCFRHADGRRVLLVGPAALNLLPAWREAEFTALPGQGPLGARFYQSDSVLIVELVDVPEGTNAIGIRLREEKAVLPVKPSLVRRFAGRKILFTMSKDNERDWIADWARYHARRHGADAIVFFDNGSTGYRPAEIAETLRAVPGIAEIAVHDWPWRYGAPDPRILNNPFYTLFLQVAAMSVTLRRYGEAAVGLLNCDVDELAAAPSGESIFGLARQSRQGLVVFPGQFVEPLPLEGAPHPARHADFRLRLRDAKARLSRPRKWVLDPSRPWVRSLTVHPYMHWIHGRPAFSKSRPEGVFYWHFKGINTGWKDDRRNPAAVARDLLEPDPVWNREAEALEAD